MPSPRIAIKYVESSIKAFRRRVTIFANFFYIANVLSLTLAVAPGIIYASVQTAKSDTDNGTYSLIIISTVIVSSVASFITATLNFFLVSRKYSEAKTIYYGMVAEYTLYKAGAGPYADNAKPHLTLLTKINQQMKIPDIKSFANHKKEDDRGWMTLKE